MTVEEVNVSRAPRPKDLRPRNARRTRKGPRAAARQRRDAESRRRAQGMVARPGVEEADERVDGAEAEAQKWME